MSRPLVSVVIPAFNADRTIDRALTSVFAQDYQPLEIIVVDDGSTDETAARVARYRSKMVRLLRLERNRGVAAATNAGLGVAKGEFIAFLDADDEWLPGKLRIQVPLLVANPSMPFVCSRWQETDPLGSVTEQPDPDLYRRSTHPSLWRDLLATAFVLKSTVVARSSYLDATGGFDARLSPADDQDMWIRLALLGVVGCRMEALTVYHRTPGSLTQRYHLREKDFVLPMVTKHIHAQRHSLTPKEIHRILGARYAQIGRSLYQAGRYFSGLYYLGRAILLGAQPGTHLVYILIASPPGRRLRHHMRSACRGATPK
jgi:glycosyltransferase involved in cell wall biosynthesis